MRFRITMALTVMAAGRAMTLAYIWRAGDGGIGDPPRAWLMPLIGDAAVGVAAVLVAIAMWRRPSPGVWVAAMIWTSIAAFDAVAAYVVEISAPWPEFFMLELVGRSMFFAATAMHLVILYLLTTREVRARFGLADLSRVEGARPLTT